MPIAIKESKKSVCQMMLSDSVPCRNFWLSSDTHAIIDHIEGIEKIDHMMDIEHDIRMSGNRFSDEDSKHLFTIRRKIFSR
jgi:hypothetical protein